MKNFYVAFKLSYALRHYVNRHGAAEDDKNFVRIFRNLKAPYLQFT